MFLVIAEKPSLARDIASALPGTATKGDGCVIKGDYIVTWLFGHMLELKAPDDYNDIYKKWDLSMLPIFFENWEQKVSSDSEKAKKVKQIGEWLKQAKAVIHAGDPDEEGQLLVDEILRLYNYQGPVKRLDTGNTTTEALKKALRNMRDNKTCENAGWSAYARSVADLMVGVNLSRFFTCNNPGATLTVGRVQTPTLGLVVARDNLIENHIKSKYYNIFADIDVDSKTITTKFNLPDESPYLDDGKITDASFAEKVKTTLVNRSYDNIVITKKKLMESPPLPFNLVKLQSFCGKHFGFSPAQVLSITQNLREKYKAITYNRSDCQYLSDEHFAEAPAVLARVMNNLGANVPVDTTIKSRCFNSANITAHFAIIPTDQAVDISKLTDAEVKVYKSICKYYLAQFMPKAEKEKTDLKIELKNGSYLSATSTRIVSPGYLQIMRENIAKGEVNDLSTIPEGTYSGNTIDVNINEEETKPPQRYTKSTLNEDMTRIAKYVDDPAIKQMLIDKDKDKKGENGSIGTSATRSMIIENLVSRGFLKEENKKLISTPLGRELCRILPQELVKPNMTGEWWVIQEEITNGTKQHSDLTSNVLDTIRHIISQTYPRVDGNIIKSKNEANVIGTCPRCGGNVIETKLGFCCSNWKEPTSCKFNIYKKSKSPLFSKTTFTAATVKKFLQGKSVTMKKLYSSKKDTTFEADVIMKDDPTNPYGPQFEIQFKGGSKK